MKNDITTILLISNSTDVAEKMGKTFAQEDGFRLTCRAETLRAMNGTAVSLTSRFDVVFVDTEASEEADFAAVKRVSDGRATNSLIIALTSDDMPVARGRKLTQAGADDVIPMGCIETDLPELVENWRLRRAAQLPAIWTNNTQGKILAVAGSRGGVGKSTLAVNLADALQNKKGFRHKEATASVAVLDLDLQFGSVAALLDVAENDGIYRMAIDGTIPDRDYVQSCLVKSGSGLNVMPAPTRFTPLDALQAEQISAILDQLSRHHDYVVVDMPSALVGWMEPVLSRASRLFLATDVTVPAIRTCRKLIDFYVSEQPNIDIEIVVTMERKPMFMSQHHREAIKLLERDFHHWLPLDVKPARETLDRGKTVFDLAPRSPLAKAIRSLAMDTIRDLPGRSMTAAH